MHPLFLLRHFNDVDHITPIMWHCLEQGDIVTAVLVNTDYPAAEDPRLQFLTQYENFSYMFADELLNLKVGSGLFSLGHPAGTKPANRINAYARAALQKSNLWRRRVINAFEQIDPTACIFEWGPPDRATHWEFFQAATTFNIPRICVPHGLNIYTNEDITPGRAEAFNQGKKHLQSRNEYDAYVTQSEHDKKQEGKLGIYESNHHVLGSTRYYPEWQSINEGLYRTYEATGSTDNKAKVVFMLPHWGFRVEKETTLKLLSRLAERDRLYLVVKEHTRGDSLPQRLDNKLVRRKNTDVVADVPSVSLIKWSDVVLNFGSSIGIEALQQDKYHVNPSYLHSNTTIFNETEAGHRPGSNEETITMVRRIFEGEIEPVSESSKKNLYKSVVYGGRGEHNVLTEYRKLIDDLSGSVE